MKYYIEITLIENLDINLFSLWSKVFQQIHLGLVEIQNEQKRVPIGISFPDYVAREKFNILGSKLRLFAPDETTLARFDAVKWLERLSDYVHCTGIRPVPEKLSGYAVYQRVQPQASKEVLARRFAKRHPVAFEEALARYALMEQSLPTLPYIRLKSLSSGNDFCLWIKKQQADEPAGSSFNTYGLSSSSTVPEF
jgi:CRISPR-associated endonuclease Csy4